LKIKQYLFFNNDHRKATECGDAILRIFERSQGFERIPWFKWILKFLRDFMILKGFHIIEGIPWF